MKIVFFTDIHGMSRKPSARLDDYSQAILGKLDWIRKYCEDNMVDIVLIGGDILDSPDVSENFIREMCMIFKRYPCPIYTVIGNHDEYGYNPDTFYRTTLGVAEGVGVLNRLSMSPLSFVRGGYCNASITGMDSYYDLDKPGHIEDYTNTPVSKDATVNIHVVHGMLVEKEWPMVSCTTIDEVMANNPGADIILTGHEHTGFGVITKYREDGRKVMFCNPGSLGRITSSTGDVRKDVRISVIEVSPDDFYIDLVNLPVEVAKPANEVINWEEIALEKANKKKAQDFIDKVQNIEVNKNFNIYENLKDLARNNNVGDDVVEECRGQLEKAQEQMKNE